jgi:hypothetical protein
MPPSPLLTAAFTSVYEDRLMDAIHTVLAANPPSNPDERAVLCRLFCGLAVTATIGDVREEEYADAVQMMLDSLDVVREIHEN